MVRKGKSTTIVSLSDAKDTGAGPCSVSIYHKLRTSSLEDTSVKLSTAQAKRMEKAVAMRRKIAASALEATLLPQNTTGMTGSVRLAIGKPAKGSDRQNSNGKESRKHLMDTMRRVVLLSSVRRVQERAFGTRLKQSQQQPLGEGVEQGDAEPSVPSGALTSLSGRWQLALRSVAKGNSGRDYDGDDDGNNTGAILPYTNTIDTTPKKEDPWQQACSLTPFIALQKLMRALNGNFKPGSAGDHRMPAVPSSPDSGGGKRVAEIAAFARSGGSSGCGDSSVSSGRNGGTGYDSNDRESDGGSAARPKGENNDSSVSGLSLGDLQKIDSSLADLREKAALSLPRNAPIRGKIALARIDAILQTLVEEVLAAVGEDSSDEGNPTLSHDDVEAVISYVDMDESGEIDARELQVAISAAKQGKMSDESLAGCMLKIDDELRLRHLRIRDVFGMLDADGSGTLSRQELAEGLSTLCGHDRVKIIQRRQALRRRKAEQKAREDRRRADVVGFLTNTESLPEEIVQPHEFFASEITNEDAFKELIRRVSDEAGDEDIGNNYDATSDEECHCTDNRSGVPTPRLPRQQQQQQEEEGHQYTRTNGLRRKDAQLDYLKDSLLRSRKAAGPTAAARPEKTTLVGSVRGSEDRAKARSAKITAATAAVAKSAMRIRGHAAGPARGGVGLCSSLSVAAIAGQSRSSPAISTGPGAEKRWDRGWEPPRSAGVLSRPGMVGEDVVERQKKYNLHDRYLRVYLQRNFERERLPLLFAARSKSLLHGYTVRDPFSMAKKQAAKLPRLM